jgi:hypothetical protein
MHNHCQVEGELNSCSFVLNGIHLHIGGLYFLLCLIKQKTGLEPTVLEGANAYL